MKQDADPIAPAIQEHDADACRATRRRQDSDNGNGLRKPQLKLTSMIDVVFLLLIFFVVTASFQIDEGSLLAKMPGNSADPSDDPPPPTVRVELRSSDDGVTYSLQVDGVPIDGATGLSAYMANRVQTGQIAADDFIEITPQGEVRWQHVVNVYNACVSAELSQVAFAY
jgi:biopolymer transport protein ExbD